MVWVPVGVDVIVGAVTANDNTPVRFVAVPIEPVTLKDIVLPCVCASSKFLIWLRLTGVPTGVAGTASPPPPPPHADSPMTTHKPTAVHIMLFLILHSSFTNYALSIKLLRGPLPSSAEGRESGPGAQRAQGCIGEQCPRYGIGCRRMDRIAVPKDGGWQERGSTEPAMSS